MERLGESVRDTRQKEGQDGTDSRPNYLPRVKSHPPSSRRPRSRTKRTVPFFPFFFVGLHFYTTEPPPPPHTSFRPGEDFTSPLRFRPGRERTRERLTGPPSPHPPILGPPPRRPTSNLKVVTSKQNPPTPPHPSAVRTSNP